jgi:hypothetical protein
MSKQLRDKHDAYGGQRRHEGHGVRGRGSVALARKALRRRFGKIIILARTLLVKHRMRGILIAGLARRYGLRRYRLDELANWAFGDSIFSFERDAFFDVNKARRFGFNEMNLDSEREIVRFLRELGEQKIIPA